MVPFVCSGCGAQLQIDDKWAGGLGHCPHCGTDSRVPAHPKRTSKLTILARMTAIPLAGVTFYSLFMGWCFFIGGVVTLAAALFFLWAFTNAWSYVTGPREYYRLWKKGGGDPFFDTLPPMFNPDPESTRYQELYRLKQQQECEAVNRQFGLPPDFMTGPKSAPPAPSQTTDDLKLSLE
jgi:hypothetical protein